MAIFAVIGSNQPEKLDEIIKNNFHDHYALGNGQWLVAEPKATTQEVSAKIGDEGENGIFIVIPVNNFWGRHYSTTWEWLQQKGS